MNQLKKLFNFFETKFAQNDRVYIVPTKLGLSFIAINGAVFMMALFYANNITLLFSFLLVSYLILEMIQTNNEILKLKIYSLSIKDHFSNTFETCHLQTNLEAPLRNLNIAFLDQTFLIDTNKSSFKVSKFKRGKHTLKKIKVSSTSNAELFYAWKYLAIDSTFYVYPQKCKTEISFNSKSDKDCFVQDQEFSHHIRYQKGLNSNRIDWKVYAKTNELYWKKNESISLENFHFDLINQHGDLEEKLSKLSFLIDHAHKNNAKWSLKVNDTFLPLSQHNDHFLNSMRAISVVEYE